MEETRRRSRATSLALALLLVGLGSSGAEAALKKLLLRTVNITDSPFNTPNPLLVGAECCPGPPFDAAVLAPGGPGPPALQKLVFKSSGTITVDLAGTFGPGSVIFLSNDYLEGPGPIRKPPAFTGTGSASSGSSIAWGIVTGWTSTGAVYCASSPPVVCTLANQGDETTGEPPFTSDFFDLGTWFFHGTGFTATPWVWTYFTAPPGNFGNNQRWLRAYFAVDATVPMLSWVGVALATGSLAAGGLAALHRRRP